MHEAQPHTPRKRTTITAPDKPDRATLCARFWSFPDDALVDRPTAGAAANLSAKSMELLATKGGGPAYVVIGRCALYRKADVLAWLAQAGRKITTSAERAPKAVAEVAS